MTRWIRRIGYVVGTLVVLVIMLSGFVVYKTNSMMTKKYATAPHPITVVSDSVALARGEHLVTVIGKCTNCHTANLGGKIFIDDAGGLGQVVAPNLTRGAGGVGNLLSDDRMAHAIRRGIKHDSTTALVMPADDYQYFSDEDVAAVIAYVRSLPPVDHQLPMTKLGPLGRALSVAGQLPIFMAEQVDPNMTFVKTVVPDSSIAYGDYLAHTGGCTGCHGPTLSGGKIPGTPPEWPSAANITPTGVSKYTDEQIENILRTGKRPDGTSVNDIMPWKYTTNMTPLEMRATLKYLRTVKPKAFGGR